MVFSRNDLFDPLRHLPLVLLRGLRLPRQQVGGLPQLLSFELVEPPRDVESVLLGEAALARAGVGGLAFMGRRKKDKMQLQRRPTYRMLF